MKHPLRLVMGLMVVAMVILAGIWWKVYWSAFKEGEDVERRTTLVIGSVSVDAEDDIKEYQPIADYLAGRLQGFGYTAGEVKVATSSVEMSQLMRRGQVDLYFDSVFPVFAVDRLTGSQPLVNRWKSGVEKYHTVIFTKKSSGVDELNDLRGKVIVFDHPESTSGYFFPKSVLLDRGYKLKEVGGPGEVVGLDEIGYYFAYDDSDLVQAVTDGTVIAGAQNQSEVEEKITDEGGAVQDYRYLLQTPDVYRHIVTANKSLSEEVRVEIKNSLVVLEQSEEGKKLLKEFKKTTRFVPFEPDYRVAYSGIEPLLELVEDEVMAR